MNENKLNIGIVGCYQNGKSTFVNCLLDDVVARTGQGISTTSINTRYVYGDVQKVEYCSGSNIVKSTRLCNFLSTSEYPENIDEIVVTLWKPLLKNINIIDTPGFNANDTDDAMALNSLNGLDAAIVILTNKGISIPEKNIILELFRRGIPYFIIINCTDKNSWNPNSKSNMIKMENLNAELKCRGISPWSIDDDEIISTNLCWFWYASEQYLNEDSKDKICQIETDIKSYLDNMSGYPESDYFLERSNFLKIRNFFSADKDWGIPFKNVSWKIAFKKKLFEWNAKMNNIAIKFKSL